MTPHRSFPMAYEFKTALEGVSYVEIPTMGITNNV